MASGSDSIPTKIEVEKQLERMLASKRLIGSPNRHMLLEFVVKRYLENTEISENIIGYDLFEGYKADESDIVRVTAYYLRQTLADYYAEEGSVDPIRIELPPGRKYQPVFAYNPRAAAHKAYSRGRLMLSQMHVQRAEDDFTRATELRPDYAEPYLGLAELHLLAPMWPITNQTQGLKAYAFDRITARTRLPAIRLWLATALRLSPESWRVHLLRGVVHSYEYRWSKAEKAFEKALALDERATRDDVWYLAYLVARGRMDEVFGGMKGRIRDNPNNTGFLALNGLLLYLRRDFEEALRAFADVSSVEREHWYSTVAGHCATLEALGPDPVLLSLRDGSVQQFPFPASFPGLLVLCLARRGRTKEAREKFAHFKESSKPQAVQSALAYMGLGDNDSAVMELARACDDRDPLMLWLHLWPIFDPLRDHEGFKALIERIGVTQSRTRLLP